MNPFRAITSRVQAFVHHHEHRGTRLGRALRYAYDLHRYCWSQLREDRAGQMAAALTYHTLFSMLPTIVLALVVLKQFVGPAEQEQFKHAVLNWTTQWLESSTLEEQAPTGLEPAAEALAQQQLELARTDVKAAATDALDVDDTPSGAAPPPVLAAPQPDDVLGTPQARAEFVRTRAAVETAIQDWMERLSRINFASIGVVGVLLFIYGATGLLATIERSFNFIYDTSSSRPVYIRVPLYYTAITLGPIVIIAGQILQRQSLDLLREAQWTNWLVGPLVVLSPLVAIWLVLFLLYVLLPNTRVHLRPAAIGSLLAAIGLVVGVELFSVYVARAAVATLYGALALLPLTLMFFWIMWIIVLFGLEVTYALQTLPGRRLLEAQKSRQDKSDEEKHLYDPRWMIPIMTRIAQQFEEGKAVRVDQLAHELHLPAAAVSTLTDRLAREGLLHRVETAAGAAPTYTLARPPHAIAVADLLDVGQRLSMGDQALSDLPGRSLLEQIKTAQSQALAQTTLAAVVPARP